MVLNHKFKRVIAIIMIFVCTWNLDSGNMSYITHAAENDGATNVQSENEQSDDGGDAVIAHGEQELVTVGAQAASFYVNGMDAAIPSEGFDRTAAVGYRTEINCVWTGAEAGKTVDFMYLGEQDVLADTPIDQQEWKYLKDAVLLPGNYYLAYNYNEAFYGNDYQVGFRVTKVNVSAPSEPIWSAENPMVATWQAPVMSDNNKTLDGDVRLTYSITLYKDGESVSTVEEAALSHDFESIIRQKGYGTYTFCVKAVVDAGGDRYSNSVSSAISTECIYRDTEAPQIKSFSVGDAEAETECNRLVAEAVDNVAVTACAFTTSDTAPATESDVWMTAGDADENGIYRFVSPELDASGAYYVYVRDAEGNVTSSKAPGEAEDVPATIKVTRILRYATMTEESLDTETETGVLWLFGDSDSVSLENPVVSGYNFEGWYENKNYTGEKVTLVQIGDSAGEGTRIPAGTDYKIYAKYVKQTYDVQITASDETKEYDGTGEECGITLTAKLGEVDYDSISYAWSYSADASAAPEAWQEVGNGNTGSDVFTNTFTIHQVAQTGTYRVVVTITLGGKTYTASADKTVTITKKPLTLTLQDQEIYYGDAAPETYPVQATGLVASDNYETMLADGAITLGNFETDYEPSDSENSNVRDYTIRQSADSETIADNYTVTVIPGTLTVLSKNVAASDSGVMLTFRVRKTETSNEIYEGTDVMSDDTYYYPITYAERYTGLQIEPVIIAWDGDKQIPVSCYDVVYTDNINAAYGKAKANVTFQGNYDGKLAINFDITKQIYDSALRMKDTGGNMYTEQASWTYGETAFIPDVTKNPAGAEVKYYYAPQTAGEELDFEVAVTSMPQDAGAYYAWAVVAESDNYEEVKTDAFPFTIEKRSITITAVSYIDDDDDTVHNAWTYDGVAHAADSYTQEGSFVGADAFRSVTVTGTITDCGIVDNVISYELTPSTNAENYEIVTVNGKLQVKKIALPVPNGFSWDASEPGTLTFTPVSRKNLIVVYRIALYREDADTPFYETTIEGSSLDVSEEIKANAESYGVVGYKATITTVPKAVLGTAYENYNESDAGESELCYVAKVNINKDASIEKVTSASNEEVATLYLLSGESVKLKAVYKDGYHKAFWVPGMVTPVGEDAASYVGITGSEENEKTITALGDMEDACEVNLNVSAQDASPLITVFQAENTSDASMVKFTMEAYDAIGMDGYALVRSEDGMIDTTSLTFKSMEAAGEGRYVATEDVKKAGTYYLVVKDSSGNLSQTTTQQAISVYAISFDNGAAEDDSLFGGTDMPVLYKVENTTITLPAVTYTKKGSTFKNWAGTSGHIYNDKAAYAANADDTLTAQWSDEKYSYQVNYYYMELTVGENGVVAEYPLTPQDTKTYTGGYNVTIANDTETIQLIRDGFELDTTEGYVNSVILGTTENPVVNVYYKRSRYTIRYQYMDPETNTQVEETDDYYFGQTYAVRENPVKTGYTFSGWDFGDFDTSEKTMPAKNLTVTGKFTADTVNYKVVYYLQNQPDVTGSITGDNYVETPSGTYTLDTARSEEGHALQGADVQAKIADAPEIEGFTIKAVSVTNGGADTTTLPADASVQASGKADAANQLYINYYYTRNTYELALNVYKDKRDVTDNLIYNHTWTFSYGKIFDTDEITYLETYGYSDNDAENEWIDSFKDEEGNILSKYASYILADYTDWSTGGKPTAMPAGNVSITKEYVEKTSAGYQVEFYLQTMDSNNNLVYPENANYTVYYYDSIGKTVRIDGEDHSGAADLDRTIYLNYNTIGAMLDGNFSAYTYDAAASNVDNMVIKSDEEAGEGDNKLRVYFKRNDVNTTIVYRYKKTGETEYTNIISYTFRQPWGTSYTFDPAAYYYGTGTNPEATYQYGTLADGTVLMGTVSNITSNSEALVTNYNDGLYAISYESRQYFANKGYSWTPTSQINTAEELSSRRTLSYPVGQASTGSAYGNYIYVNYIQVDEIKTYEMDLYYSGISPNIRLTETTGDDFKVIYEDDTQAPDGTTYYIRIANENDILGGGYAGKETEGHDNYKVESNINVVANASSGTLPTGFKKVSVPYIVEEESGPVTYYATYYEYTDGGGQKYLYILNKDNSFIWGKRLSFNVEGTSAQNAAKLGRNEALSKVEEGYKLLVDGSYNAITPVQSADGKYYATYYYYKERVDQKVLTFVMGGKTSVRYVDYNSTFTPATDSVLQGIFTADEGYRIVWYEDAAYTIPAGDKTYTIKENKTFYGRREKSLIENYSYISYELSNNLRLQRTMELQDVTASVDGKYYITEANYTAFPWTDVTALTKSGYEVLTQKVEKKYIDNNQYDAGSATGAEIPYMAERSYYYIDGELVLIREENAALSYSSISLAYNSVDYAQSGFAYSEKNVENKSQGYCQKEPVSLCAFYERLSYVETEISPSVANNRKDKATDYTRRYGDRIVLETPERVGYTFAGWKFETKGNEVIQSQEIDPAQLSYTEPDTETNKKATFVMPPYDITVSAMWEPAEFDYNLVTYFQQEDESYKTALMEQVFTVADSATDVTINYEKDGNSENYAGKKVVLDTEAVCFYEKNGVTYYFLCNTTESEAISVSAKNLIAAIRSITVKTGTSYNISDYCMSAVNEFEIFGYAFTSFSTDETTTSLGLADTFKADPSMTLSYYYSRNSGYQIRLLGLSADSREGVPTDNGLTLKGEGNSYYYGQSVSVTAIVEQGYTFKGWYKASDVLANYRGFGDTADLQAFEELKSGWESAIPYISTSEEDAGSKTTKYVTTVTLEESMDLVAVTEPVSLDAAWYHVDITAGNTDYTYGYAQTKDNYLTAKVTINEAYTDLVSVVGYQWYAVDGENAVPTEENKITGATSSTYLIPTGKDAGTYYYQCVVTFKHTGNGRQGTAFADSAYPITVKQIDGRYYTSADYNALYDGGKHSISLSVDGGTIKLIPQKYDIYYSENELTTWEAVQVGLSDDSVVKGDGTGIPEAFLYKDVELEGDTVKTHTVYYYIRTDEAELDKNFKDTFGSNTVTIRPITLTLGNTADAFEKIYDADRKVSGSLAETNSDYYRLIKGDNGKTYYTIGNSVLNAESGWNLSCSADFNSSHVEDANAVTLSSLQIVNADGTVNPNYRFAVDYTFTLSANINAYQLNLTWSEEDSFVYDGDAHAVQAGLTNAGGAPDTDLTVISVGAQKNVGTYTATAALDVTGKTYKASDYYFDITSKQYTITPCPITVSPKATALPYTGEIQYITAFTVTKNDETSDIDASTGNCPALKSGQKFGISAIQTDKGATTAGEHDISVVKESVKIYDEAGADITYNYDITAGSGKLTIGQQSVTVSGIQAEKKEYDGTDAAKLKTKEVTIGDEKIEVLDGAVVDGIVSGDTVYVRADAATNVHFEQTGYGIGIRVMFTLSDDALVGADAENYILDVEHSQSETTADITKHEVTVKVTDLSAGTMYGITPDYAVTYDGFLHGDTETVVSGTPVYLLDGVDYSSNTYSVENIGEHAETITGTKIPYKEGGYKITLATEDGYVTGLTAENYVFVPDEAEDARLVITKRPLSITEINRAPVITKVYDSTTDVKTAIEAGTDYNFDVVNARENNCGLLPDDEVSITYQAAYNSADVVSATTIQVTNVALSEAGASGNYTLVDSSKAFEIPGEITKAKLTVTADHKDITYGEAAPEYTATATGYVGSDRENDSNSKTLHNGDGITLSCEYDTNDAAKRGARDYAITISGLTDSNYELESGSADNQTLTVQKKTVTAGVEDVTIIYGKEEVPTSFNGTFTGWVESYGDTTENVLGANPNVTYTLESASDYPYKAEGYTITVDCSQLDADNYTFEPKNGKLMVNRQFISVNGIQVKAREYDGTRSALIDYSNIKFTCYVNQTSGTEYSASALLPGGAEMSAEALEQLICENLAVTGTYAQKDVGTNIPVSLDISLKDGSYLAQRYVLIETEEDASNTGIAGATPSQTATTGDITKRPITIQVYYDTLEDSKILYGEEINANKYGYKVIHGSFVSGEGIDNLNGEIQYQIVNASGVVYSPTSGVGTYYVKQTGTLSDAGTNYKLTIVGAGSEVTTNTPITVEANTLEMPEPLWSDDAPGTITWNKVEDIGNVAVKEYKVKLFKGEAEIAEGAKTIPADASVKYSIDYSDIIRVNGEGTYTVSIQAIATTGENNPAGNPNVLDSNIGESDELYVAKITVAYAEDSVTAAAATIVGENPASGENTGCESSIIITDTLTSDLDCTSYVVIDGETITIQADWYNADGYRTGYKLSASPWTIQTGDVATTALTVVGETDNSAHGSYTASVKADLTSSNPITMKLVLEKRSATLGAGISPETCTVSYGYTQEEAPAYTVSPNPLPGDNVDASLYTYTYKWTYFRPGMSEASLTNAEGRDDVSAITVKTGIQAYTSYTVRCEITATRKDNGESVTLTGTKRPSAGMTIKRATINAETMKAVVSGWTYGEERNTPELKYVDGDGLIPSGIGTVHYYYSEDSTTDRTLWTEWKAGSEPKDAGTYYLYAKVEQSTNYAAFETEIATEFTISKAKLGMKVDSDEILTTTDLDMEASEKAPYGIAFWPAVAEPKENGNSTTSYITASYQVTLYRLSETPGESDTMVKQYAMDAVDIDANTHICRLDMTDDMNKTGTYYYTVLAKSSNLDNCKDSDMIRSGNYMISTDIQVQDADGNNLLSSDSRTVTYTYNAKKVTLLVGATGTYQWYRNGVAITGATGSSYEVQYVKDSAVYSCRITAAGKTYDTTHIDITIQPRTITIVTGDNEKVYDGTALIKDAWKIAENNTDATVSGAEFMTESKTGNTVSGVQVTGTLTDVAFSDGQVTEVENTCDLTNLVITEASGETIYNASMVSAGTANYTVEAQLGSLLVTKRPVTITSGSSSKTYDGTALTVESYITDGIPNQVSSGLVSGHNVSAINYTATITNVAYDENGEVTTIDNTFNQVKIEDAAQTDVTANYEIIPKYGTLKIKPEKLTEITISQNDFTFNGSLQGPDMITVYADNASLTPTENRDYTITDDVENRKVRSASAVGTYTIEAVGKGNYTGTVSVTYSIIDREDPVISGVENGKEYCEAQTITVTDANLKEVVIKKQTGDSWMVVHRKSDITNGRYTYELVGSETGNKYEIIATDVSENTNETMLLTVYNCHDFTDYSYANVEKTRRKADCNRGCGAVDERVRAWGTVEWQYDYSYSVPDSVTPESGVQGVNARATYAYVRLKQNGTVIATKLVNCDDICGNGANTPAITAVSPYEFTSFDPNDASKSSGSVLLPVNDTEGNPYTYVVEVTPVKKDGDAYVEVQDYSVTYSQDYTGEDGYKAHIAYQPGCFDVPWQVTIDDYKQTEDGRDVVPDCIYVKVLFAYSEYADDSETDSGYQIISQQADEADIGVLCEKVRQPDGSYTYSGSYPVWKYQGGTTKSYYHRIQVVGYVYQGQTYSVVHDNYKSINDMDHVNHTIFYVPGSDGDDNGTASGTIQYDFSGINLPVVVFDYNESDDTYNVATKSVYSIVKYTIGEPVTETEISAVTSERPGYEFLGWYTAAEGGSKVVQIASLDAPVTLYAHWRETEKPTGTIYAGEQAYSTYAGDISFEHYTAQKTVEITANDSAGTVSNSGVKKIEYYISDTYIPLEALQSRAEWNTYNGPFELTTDGNYVIYARITDYAGNETFISTDGIVVDTEKPVITGVENGQTACDRLTFSVHDAHMERVIVNGTDITSEMDDNSYELILHEELPAFLPQSQVIQVYDKAGNMTEYTVILHNGHTYKPETVIRWSEDYTTATAEFVCERDDTHTLEEACTVTKTTEGNEDIYVATIVFDGEEYTDTIRIVNDTTSVGQDGEIRVRVVLNQGIHDIPDTLVAHNLDTEEKIYEKLKNCINENSMYVYEDDNLILYDVKLQVSFNSGRTWHNATEDNFPDGGLSVTLPYPEEVQVEGKNFVVAHMFTHNFRGVEAGDVECPEVTAMEDGVHFTVKSLSPIMLGWSDVLRENEDPATTEASGSTPEQTAVKTGDNHNLFLVVLLAILSGSGIIYIYRRREDEK